MEKHVGHSRRLRVRDGKAVVDFYMKTNKMYPLETCGLKTEMVFWNFIQMINFFDEKLEFDFS